MAQLGAAESSRCISKFESDMPPWEDSNFDVMETCAERAILEGRNGLHQSLQIRISARSQRDEFSFCT
jgi:hypothetical protein